jgi:hypothetical protein
MASFPSPEIRYEPFQYWLRQSTLPLPTEQVTIEVQRNKGENRLASLFHQCLLFVERPLDFPIYPPTLGKRLLGATEQDFIPDSDAPI